MDESEFDSITEVEITPEQLAELVATGELRIDHGAELIVVRCPA